MSGPNDYEIRVDVSIQNYQGGGNLRLSEQVVIPGCTFEDMAGILGSFHGLAESIQSAKRKATVVCTVTSHDDYGRPGCSECKLAES